MRLRPTESRRPDDDPIPAIVSPLSDRSDDEVLRWLKENGASQVELLAPGFISASACSETLDAAKKLARVEIKRPKRFHRR